MKRKLFFLLIAVFLLGTIVGSSEGYSKTITAWFYDIKVNLDGSAISFNSQPFMYNGQVYVPIHDIAQDLGLTVQWHNPTKTVNLTSADNHLLINALQYELDRKNLEIHHLKFQLEQKDLELSMLKEQHYDDDEDDDHDDILEDLEELLEDDYNRYRYYSTTLDFEYSLSQLSNDNIRVRMYGDFDKNAASWEDRNKSDFRDFIEDICKEIDEEFNEDIEVFVYDEDRDRIAEYLYDDRDNEITDYDEE